MVFKKYLQMMAEHDASDLFLTTHAPPSIKVHGRMRAIDSAILAPGRVKEISREIISEKQIKEFEHTPELNLAIADPDLGRFRVNIFQQRNEMAMVVRSIKTVIPSIEELGLPPILKKLVMEKRGLCLLVGATSTGKSTSLASMIDHRNTNSSGHIVTVEDPIEYVHANKSSIVNQREVGIDTLTYGDALKNTLRQAPDIILIGEIRTQETMEYAISFSETGHLCLSTLHAGNAEQALDRIIHFFSSTRREQIALDLSLNLLAIISQRLIPAVDGTRVPAVEVLLATPLVRDLIKRGEIDGLKEVMEKSENLGMQSFDTALYRLYKEGKISEEEALANADSQNNLRLKISLEKGTTGKDAEKLSLKRREGDNDKPLKPGEFFVDDK